MENTKEEILHTALRLFARDGYEAVSVSSIAGKLGMTKGALYKHYENKRDIFDSILRRMEQRDAEQAARFDLPETAFDGAEEQYRRAAPERVAEFGKAMFRYWTQDEFAAAFRRMLTLEQFRNEEMMRLYQQYLAAGPLGYLCDLFRPLGEDAAREAALGFYAPLFFLYGLYDGAQDKDAVIAMADASVDGALARILSRSNHD